MKADIISIGDEILIGQITNTNAVYLGDKLTRIGFTIRRMIAIADKESDIIDTLNESIQSVDLVVLTGGLGPTNDDITKDALKAYFGGNYVIHEPSLQRLKEFLAIRNVSVSERNSKQVEVPDSCEVLLNTQGAAPGMLFRKDNTIVVSVPGVPFEMKGIFEEKLKPLLLKEFDLPVNLHTTILTVGLPESSTADKIKDWEDALPKEAGLAYLPSPGILRLRISVSGNNRNYLNELLNKLEQELVERLGQQHVFGRNLDTLQEVVGQLLTANNYTLATAESCTGGNISHLITLVPGSSVYYKGSVTAYANDVKQELLGVEPEIIKHKGAVSKEVVEQMATGARKVLNADFAVATSGIAGPTGGTKEKPVGTTWIAVATPKKVISKKYFLGNKRDRCIAIASSLGLNMLRNAILDMH